jgi:hypothetical protein
MIVFRSSSSFARLRLCRNRCNAWGFALACSLITGGCGNDQLMPVHGSVKNEDQLVTGGSVVFKPVGEGRPAFGPIQSDGTFQLTTLSPNDGAMIGQYRVTVAGKRDPGTERTGPTYIGPPALLFEVAAGKDNAFQIHIRKADGWKATNGG